MNNNNNNENYSTRANKEFGKITKAYHTTVSEQLRSIINSEIDYYKLDDPEKREQRLQRVNDITSNVYKIKINRIQQELDSIKTKRELTNKEIKHEKELHDEKINRLNLENMKLDETSNKLNQQLKELKESADEYNNYIIKERKDSLKNVFNEIIVNYFNNKEFNEVTVNSIIEYEFEYIHLPKIAIINHIQEGVRDHENKVLRIPDSKKNREINRELTKDDVNRLCTILGNAK